jgi:hypothetical protein
VTTQHRQGDGTAAQHRVAELRETVSDGIAPVARCYHSPSTRHSCFDGETGVLTTTRGRAATDTQSLCEHHADTTAAILAHQRSFLRPTWSPPPTWSGADHRSTACTSSSLVPRLLHRQAARPAVTAITITPISHAIQAIATPRCVEVAATAECRSGSTPSNRLTWTSWTPRSRRTLCSSAYARDAPQMHYRGGELHVGRADSSGSTALVVTTGVPASHATSVVHINAETALQRNTASPSSERPSAMRSHQQQGAVTHLALAIPASMVKRAL